VIIGRGSNTVVADGDHDLVLIDIDMEPQLTFEHRESGWNVRVGATWALPQLARQLADHAVGGFAWAVGVPGSLGGAVVMNAGGHGGEMSHCVVAVQVLDVKAGSIEWLPVEDLHFAYRHSDLTSTQVVLAADLSLPDGSPDELRAQMSEIVAWRREHQPGGRNAGSVFRNPPGDHAARLIETAGLKGLRVGGAEVSTKHANFIQALDGATASDVRELIRQVRDEVMAHSGVLLQTEIKFVGFPEEWA
jgi:UDP-N-acetylmuramate dehydrogenase